MLPIRHPASALVETLRLAQGRLGRIVRPLSLRTGCLLPVLASLNSPAYRAESAIRRVWPGGCSGFNAFSGQLDAPFGRLDDPFWHAACAATPMPSHVHAPCPLRTGASARLPWLA